MASAIAMAESGGDSKVGNYCCHGLYAINVEVGNTSMQCALSAVCSTHWTIKESKDGKDWSAWETYTNGAYKQYLGGGKVKNKKEAGHELEPLLKTPEGKTEFASFNPLEALEHAIDPF